MFYATNGHPVTQPTMSKYRRINFTMPLAQKANKCYVETKSSLEHAFSLSRNGIQNMYINKQCAQTEELLKGLMISVVKYHHGRNLYYSSSKDVLTQTK